MAKHGLNEAADAEWQLCHWGFVRHPCEIYVCHRSGNAVVHAMKFDILLVLIIWKYQGSLSASLSHHCIPPHRSHHHFLRVWWWGEIVAVGPQCSSDWA